MSNNNHSRNDIITADQKMIDGTQKNQAKLPGSFPLEGQTMTPAEVIQVFQDRIATGKAVLDAESARAAAIKADKNKRAQTRGLALAFKRFVIAMFTQQPDVLGDFGLHAPKPAAKSAAEKAQAAAKAKATRKLLGTKGSRQKKAVIKATEDHTPTPVQPAPQPAQPAPAPAPTPAQAPVAGPAKPAS
jgi:hypothetical protein